MPKPRGRSHTSLTETAATVVAVLTRLPDVKMIAPGVIDARRSGSRHVTIVYTNGGFQLIISGQGVQKVAVHTTDAVTSRQTARLLMAHKALRAFAWNERDKLL